VAKAPAASARLLIFIFAVLVLAILAIREDTASHAPPPPPSTPTVTPLPTPPPERGGTGISTLPSGAFFNVRTAADTAAAMVGQVGSGRRIAVTGAVAGSVVFGNPVWYAVTLPKGVRGYVSSSAFGSLAAAYLPWVGQVTTNGEDGITAIGTFRTTAADSSYVNYGLGATLTVLGVMKGTALEPGNAVWYRIQAPAHDPVYIYSAYLKYRHDGQAALTMPLISAAAIEVKDLDSGRLLYQRQPASRREVASLVKLITALLATEHLSLPATLTVPKAAPSVGLDISGSSMNLLPGERLTVEQLLYGLLLPSGNDAAYTLAQAISGSQGAFVRLMNEKAVALGLRNTHFADAYGLDRAGAYSTAADMATLAEAFLKVPILARIVATTHHTISSTSQHQPFDLENTNALLTSLPGVYGVKTGTTSAAGQCLVAAQRTANGRHLLAVVLGSTDRYADTTALLDYASVLDR